MLVFLQNSAAGNHDAGALRALLVDRTRSMGMQAQFINRAVGESARKLAARADAAMAGEDVTLVAVGGDGTVNIAANLAWRHERPLGIIPAGTFNLVARNHGIPEDPIEALELLRTGRPQPVQCGLINDRLFMVNASLGLYAKLLREREGFKRVLGRYRLVATLAALFTVLRPYRTQAITIECADTRIDTRATTFIVSNNRLQLELIGIRDSKEIGYGKLYSGLLRPAGRLAMLNLLLQGSRGKVQETPELESRLIRTLRVSMPSSRRRSVRVSIDGEIMRLRLPLAFQVKPEPLLLVKPSACGSIEASGVRPA